MLALNIRDRSLSGLVGRLGDDQAAPLGWLWMEKLITVALGEGERALRLQPMLFAAGVLVLSWWVGRRWLQPAGAALLVALFAVSPTLLAYSDQLKPYSADVFWVLLLIAFAARVVQDPVNRGKRWQFWLLAAAGLWMSLGALLAMPALALIVGGQALVRRDWRAVSAHVLAGVIFMVSFAGHYFLSLRYTVTSSYMAAFWSGIGYPPDGAGPKGIANWYVAALGRLSEDPLDLWRLSAPVPWYTGASTVLFWLLVLAGLVIALRRHVAAGLLLTCVLVSGLLFALLHLVPLAVRLALWLVPALYLAVAIAFQAAAAAIPALWQRARANWIGPVALTAAGCALMLPLALVPLAVRSAQSLAAEPDLDDRAAVAWMREYYQPGDVVVLVVSAQAALKWYDPDRVLQPRIDVLSVPAGSAACEPNALERAVQGHRRVIAYAGVRYSPYLETYEVLRQRLAELGTIVETQRFGTLGIVYVVELAQSPRPSAPGDCIVVLRES